MASGDFATAAERLADARPLWEQLDNRPMLGENLTLGSAMHMFHGDFEAALADARRAAEISASIGNAWGESHALITVYRVELELDGWERRSTRSRGAWSWGAGRVRLCRDRDAGGSLAADGLPGRWRAGPRTRRRVARGGVRACAPAASIAHVARAVALITLGRHAEAHAPLDEVDLMMLPEPDRTFLMGAWRTTRSLLALAEGDVDDAEAIARGLLVDLRTNGVRVLQAEALLALARAHLAADRHAEADLELAEAIELAGEVGERRVLWEALATSAELAARSEPRREADPRQRAREIVEEIAAGMADPELRRRFLARDDVRDLEEGG